MGDPATVPATSILLDFADGEYLFKLPLAQLAELQTKCDAGIGLIFSRLMRGRYLDGKDVVLNPLEAVWRYQDITEVIRLGLIGGGKGTTATGEEVKVDPTVALKLVRDYVQDRPLIESWKIAAAVLSVCVMGYTGGAAEKKSPTAKPKRKTAGGTGKVGSTTTKP